MFWISAAKTIPRQHTALPSSTIIGVQSCQKSINPDQCEPALGERMAAASAKTDYSPAVPDPSTLVGPGGVEHHIVRVRGLPWSCTGDLLTVIDSNRVASLFVQRTSSSSSSRVCAFSLSTSPETGARFPFVPPESRFSTKNLIRDGRPSGDAYMVLASLK